MAEQKNKSSRKPPKDVKPVGRNMTCSASNGGVSASASCDTGIKGDVSSCMSDVRGAVGLSRIGRTGGTGRKKTRAGRVPKT